MKVTDQKRWIDWLEEEDLSFLTRFVLLSGSLKDVAQAYGVSYPTVRLRLDRLIQKIQILQDHTIEDPFERLLRAEFAEGKVEAGTFKQLLSAYQEQKKGTQ